MSYLHKEEERVEGGGGSQVKEEDNHDQCQAQENRQQDGEEGQGVAAVPTDLKTKKIKPKMKLFHSNHGYNTQVRYEESVNNTVKLRALFKLTVE